MSGPGKRRSFCFAPLSITRLGIALSQLFGLASCRYILRIPPLVDLDVEQLIAQFAPTIQQHIFGR